MTDQTLRYHDVIQSFTCMVKSFSYFRDLRHRHVATSECWSTCAVRPPGSCGLETSFCSLMSLLSLHAFRGISLLREVRLTCREFECILICCSNNSIYSPFRASQPVNLDTLSTRQFELLLRLEPPCICFVCKP
jgi:hypothetical protein